MRFQYPWVFVKKKSTMYALIAMVEKDRKTLDQSGTFDALLPDLSKVFNYMFFYWNSMHWIWY